MTVAGIAMGLVTDGDRYAVLTDIAGLEDHLGDMDLKVTRDGKRRSRRSRSTSRSRP